MQYSCIPVTRYLLRPTIAALEGLHRRRPIADQPVFQRRATYDDAKVRPSKAEDVKQSEIPTITGEHSSNMAAGTARVLRYILFAFFVSVLAAVPMLLMIYAY